jgi:regulator of replication initiation timing
MGDNAELHQKILNFLMTEWARKDQRQLDGVDLLFAPGNGFRDEPIRKWVRADEPDFFAEFVNIEKLVTLILEIAENEADAKPAGKHRFKVVTHQHLGVQPYMSFSLSPSYTGGEETSLVPNGGGGGRGGGNDVAVAQILAGNNAQLMRTNTQMFDGTIRVLGQQNLNMHEQLTALITENATLRRELEEARSNKMDREFQIAMAAEKNVRTNAAFQKVLQLGTVVVSKFAAGKDGASQLGEGAPLPMLIGELYQSLRPDQMGTIMQTLDMAQKILFMEIVNLAKPPDKGDPKGQPPGPGGVNGSRS